MMRYYYILVISLSLIFIKLVTAVDVHLNQGNIHLESQDEGPLPLIKVGRNTLNNTLYWGTYKPHLYFGMKTRSKQPINTGLVWSTPNVDNLYARYLYKCQQGRDGVVRYEWKRHDAKNFGEQEIVDRPGNLLLSTSFVKKHHTSSKSGGDWTLRLSGRALNQSLTAPYFSMMYYIQDESMSANSKSSLNIKGASSSGLSGNVQVNGEHPELGKYTLHFSDVSQSLTPDAKFLKSQPSLSKWHFYGRQSFGEDNFDIVSTIFDDTTKQHVSSYYGEWHEFGKTSRALPPFVPTLPNVVKDQSNIVIVQRVLKVPFEIEITFVSHSTHNNEDKEKELSSQQVTDIAKDITGDKFDKLFDQHDTAFLEKFKEKFPLPQFYKEGYKSFSHSVLSNLLGGIGYWHGSTISVHPNDPNRYIKLPPVSLYSATPSRTAFPRGFLWDEGFHQLVVSSWDVELTIEALSHWFNLVNENGWIPREQILGKEAQTMVPQEFQVQSPRIANPPTLLLTVSKLIDIANNYRKESPEKHKYEIDLIDEFIRDAYPRLVRFYSFYWKTQPAHIENTFRWRGRKVNHTLASGLDDYPRANPPSTSEVHVDLASWMAFASNLLSKISRQLGVDDIRYVQSYKDITKIIFDLHWDEDQCVYQDILYYGDKNHTLVKTGGYLNYFPLFLGLEPANSKRMACYLNSLKDIKGVWGRHGIRSMSLKDPLYGTNENYWRGPIWININYLFAYQLNKYAKDSGHVHQDFSMLYYTLRHNLVDNIYQVYKDTGFLWEQYHGIEGNGERNHPFAGWTSLVLLLLTEQY